MSNYFLLAAASIALVATGMSAHAGCADPRHPAQGAVHTIPSNILRPPVAAPGATSKNAGFNIIGTWHAIYTVEGQPFGEAFIQWHDDGTEWENIDLPVESGNICMGSWKTLSPKRVFRSHIGWLFTNGVVSGYFTETETDRVSPDGTSYFGTNEQKVYDLAGNLQADVTGTSKATKITP